MSYDNLFGGPADTLLPRDPAAAELSSAEPEAVIRRYPASSLSWAVLAERALDDGRPLDAYAYARVGYHRGLDALRRSGWKGHGPVPWRHEPNRGFLRAVAALARAAREIEETEEYERCRALLHDSSEEAAATLGLA